MYLNTIQAYRAATPEYVAKQIEGVKSFHDDTEIAEIRARLEDDVRATETAIREIVKMIEGDIEINSWSGGTSVLSSVMNLIGVMRKEEARVCRLIEGHVSDYNITVADAIGILEKVGRIFGEAERRIAASFEPIGKRIGFNTL